LCAAALIFRFRKCVERGLIDRHRDILAGMSSQVARIDHVQIAAPEGCEAAAREFYGAVLGMREIEKPPLLRARGGCWFECGAHQLHVGVERDFRPARKAHPAFTVFNLDELRETLIKRGVALVDDDALPNERRFYADDPWGNRLEFIEIRN
jgi:catechol 2,3-dioxygenase-like lactoylglutathione lyase family enzyme